MNPMKVAVRHCEVAGARRSRVAFQFVLFCVLHVNADTNLMQLSWSCLRHAIISDVPVLSYVKGFMHLKGG